MYVCVCVGVGVRRSRCVCVYKVPKIPFLFTPFSQNYTWKIQFAGQMFA